MSKAKSFFGPRSDYVFPRNGREIAVRTAAIACVLVTIIYIGSRIERLSYESYVRDLRLTATLDLMNIREGIQTKIAARFAQLDQLVHEIERNPDINETEFNLIAVDFLLGDPSVRHIAAAPDLVVDMVFPKNGNAGVLGLDYRTNADQYPMVRRAIDTRTGLMTGPLELVQGGLGVILRAPVFVRPDAGVEQFWGLLSAVYDYEDFVEVIEVPQLQDQFDLLIREPSQGAGMPEQRLAGDPGVLEEDPVVLAFNFPFGAWELAAAPKGGWPVSKPGAAFRWALRIIFALGCAAALFYVLRLLDHRRAAQSMLTNGIEALDHGFVMFHPSGRIAACNKKYERLHAADDFVRLGVTYDALLDWNLKQGYIPAAVGREDAWRDEWFDQLQSGAAAAEKVLPDGRIIDMSDRRLDDGSIVGLRIDVSDIRQAQRAAEAANQAKTDFMGVLSHELRTPLTVILGHARLAKQVVRLPVSQKLIQAIETHPEAAKDITPKLDDLFRQFKDMMTRLEHSGDHLLMLINEILDFAKIDSGSLTVAPGPTTLAEIVSPVGDQMRPMIEERGLDFKVTFRDAALTADAPRVRQVLINLVGNAAKFTEKGGITLAVEQTGDMIEFRVRDTGIGIPDGHITQVFEAFHQVDASSTRRFGGTGLGLAISRDIAEAHGGTLSVSSTFGSGSEFIMRLPVNARDAALEQATAFT